jgi:hypothetical protein
MTLAMSVYSQIGRKAEKEDETVQVVWAVPAILA